LRCHSTAKHAICLLGVSGSPNEGATAFVVKEALSYAEEKFGAKTDYFSVRGKTINYCLHCDHCIREKKGCVHKDDMTLAYEKLQKADALIIGTPVYQGSVSGQIKVFLDRCRAIVAKDPDVFKDKVGAAIAVGGDRVGGQELALQTLHVFFLINKMIPVGGGPFGANLGGTVWSKDHGSQGAKEDYEGMKSIQKTAKRLLETAVKLKKLESEE
jgi:multimeric flavodoxin WrbA